MSCCSGQLVRLRHQHATTRLRDEPIPLLRHAQHLREGFAPVASPHAEGNLPGCCARSPGSRPVCTQYSTPSLTPHPTHTLAPSCASRMLLMIAAVVAECRRERGARLSSAAPSGHRRHEHGPASCRHATGHTCDCPRFPSAPRLRPRCGDTKLGGQTRAACARAACQHWWTWLAHETTSREGSPREYASAPTCTAPWLHSVEVRGVTLC